MSLPLYPVAPGFISFARLFGTYLPLTSLASQGKILNSSSTNQFSSQAVMSDVNWGGDNNVGWSLLLDRDNYPDELGPNFKDPNGQPMYLVGCPNPAQPMVSPPLVSNYFSTDGWVYSSDNGTITFNPHQTQYLTCGARVWLCGNSDGTVSFQNPTSQIPDECKWIEIGSALSCCMNPSVNQPNVCGTSYTQGNGVNACVDLVTGYCGTDWTQEGCQNYLASYSEIPEVKNVIQKTIINYINQRPGKCTNYTSKKLDPNADRDDSTDPFFVNTVPSLCNTADGACDDVLNAYCAEFTREDMINDPTLQRICGCHLSTGNATQHVCVDGACFNLCSTGSHQPQENQYPYSTDDFAPYACDPVCLFPGTIQPSPIASQCKNMNVCVMDDITVDLINSSTGNITFNQVCGCPGGECICYMNNNAINSINSISGKIDLQQNCSKCATFSGDPRNSQPSNCSGHPTPPNPPNPSGEDWETWLEDHWLWIVSGTAILMIIVIFLILIF